MTESVETLKARLLKIKRLGEISELLDWDQQTYMPHGAATARGEQSATIRQLVHEMFVDDATGAQLARAEADTAGQDPDSDDVRMLAVVRRDYDRATRLPGDLVAEISRQSAISHSIWVSARQNSDFNAFAPALEKMLDLTRQMAQHLGYRDHIYDALLDGYEPGMKQADVATMFADIKPDLVALTKAISQSARPVDDSLLHRSYPAAVQKPFTLKLASEFGFDLNRGRQDEAAHPFCSGFNRDDVRLTTRFDEAFLSQGLYATLHETGHGLYEQGLPARYDDSPLGAAVSLGVHESQSRMWENLVGRSRPYCQYVFPQLQASFPEALGGETAGGYYRAVNRVHPSLIRVEADEVTYNLHIMLRFEIECELLTGALAVKDLPAAWNDRIYSYLGVTPPDDAQGVLQDVHWSAGLIGYFPTYALGNLISGQLWNAVQKAIPSLEEDIRAGKFSGLLDWLRANVHDHGRKYLPKELIQKATGEPLTSRYYLDYLKAKFGDIYGLA